MHTQGTLERAIRGCATTTARRDRMLVLCVLSVQPHHGNAAVWDVHAHAASLTDRRDANRLLAVYIRRDVSDALPNEGIEQAALQHTATRGSDPVTSPTHTTTALLTGTVPTAVAPT